MTIVAHVPLSLGSPALPIAKGAFRFAVGTPVGPSSNSWRFWAQGNDVYLTCRDQFAEAKLSLHATGRWRFGFTEEGGRKYGSMIGDRNRAWEVWDRPEYSSGQPTVAAFRLMFPTGELAVDPVSRDAEFWKKVIFIEPAPVRKVMALSIFIVGDETPSVNPVDHTSRLAVLKLRNGEFAHLYAHLQDEIAVEGLTGAGRKAMRQQAEDAGTPVPKGGYIYAFGRDQDGVRFIIGLRAYPSNQASEAGGRLTT